MDDVNAGQCDEPAVILYDSLDRKQVWFILEHDLLYPGVGPIKLSKGIKFNRQISRGARGLPYYPFASREAWLAVRRLLNAPGVATLGICAGGVCIVGTARLKYGIIDVDNIIVSFMTLMADALSFDETTHFCRSNGKAGCLGRAACNLETNSAPGIQSFDF